jgi:hypothetical protein
MTTSETRKIRYAHYGQRHGLAAKGHKLGPASKEKRGCGPLARYNRRKAVMADYYQHYKDQLEANRADQNIQVKPLPFDPATQRMMAEYKAVHQIH